VEENFGVLVLGMPPVVVEKKVREKKKKQKKKKADPKKLEILDACATLARACNQVDDFDDARRFLKRAKEGYEEQLGPDDAKMLEMTHGLIMMTCSGPVELIEKTRELLKRMERALGEENVVTLNTLKSLGIRLQKNGEYEEANFRPKCPPDQPQI